MNAESSDLCPECGKPVPAGSPHQLCAACLMGQALASRTLIDGEDDSDIPPPLSPEEIAEKFPQFEITECLGRGGMGSVYKARQKSLDRWVAIKILAPEREGRERFAERFAREAQTLARLSHPHIVTIHDFGQTDGLFYLVMEYVDGVNLRELLRDGKIAPAQALAIIPPICDALQYAHDKGIVHRDIKPENLLLDREGRVKIADFGIASLIGAENESAGTPAYMAPEQNDAQREVDHRADIYALGVVLYEMLTGERPGKEVIAPSRKVQIDVRLDEIVLRALEKKPELRFQEASILKTMVENVSSIAGAPDQQEQARQNANSSEPIQFRKKPTAAANLAFGLLLAGIIGGALLWNIRDRQLLILLCGGTLLLALVLGLISRRRRPGKFAAIGSGVALILWAIFSINYVTSRPRQPIYGGLITSYTPLKKNNPLLAALSAEYDNSKGSGFEIGKRIEVALRFLNHSPIDIAVNPQELPPTAWLTVTDSNGQQVELDGKNEAASQLKEVRVLKSRDGTVGYTMSLLLLPKNAAATTPKEKADAMAWVEPGRYTLQFHLRLPTVSYQRDGVTDDEYRTTPLTIDVKGVPPTGNAAKPSASFGPVLGREIRLGGRLTLCGLDFESGDLFLTEDKSRRTADGQTDRKWYQRAEGWVQSKGVDMFIGGSGDDFGVAGLETQFELQEVPPEAWEAATEAELKKALERFRMWNDEGWAVKKISTNVSVPYTFALRSGDSLGLLQITERLQNPDGIKVRYKLVQEPGAPLGDLKKETAYSHVAEERYSLKVQFGDGPDDPALTTDVQLGVAFSDIKEVGQRVLSIDGQIDPPTDGPYRGQLHYLDVDASKNLSVQKSSLELALELGVPFRFMTANGIARFCVVTLTRKQPDDTSPVVPGVPADFLRSALMTIPPIYLGDIPLARRESWIKSLERDPERMDAAKGWMHQFGDGPDSPGSSMIWLKILPRTNKAPVVLVHMAKPFAAGRGGPLFANQTFVLERDGEQWKDVTQTTIPTTIDLTTHHFRTRKEDTVIEVAPWKAELAKDRYIWIFGERLMDLWWDGEKFTIKEAASKVLTNN